MSAAGLPPAEGRLIVLADQASGGRVRVHDLGAPSAAPVWEWRPSASLASWGRPTEVRLRVADRGRGPEPVMLVCDSFGGVFVVDETGATARRLDLGPVQNPHAVELLPGGALVVAASTGALVRTFSADGGEWTPLELEGAHGLVWDRARDTLWALGSRALIACRPRADRWEVVRREALPDDDGHELSAARGGDALWVTTARGVHRFDISDGGWHRADPALDGANVKAFDEHPGTGCVLRTTPELGATPDWVTSRIDVLDGPGSETARFEGAAIYKARHWLAR